MTDFIFLGSKITADSDRSHEIKRHLLLRRKAMTNTHTVLKSRPLLTKVCIVKVCFSTKSVLCIRWSKFWSFSFSISPSMNIQDQFPLGLTGLISFLSKGLSRAPQFESIHLSAFFMIQLLHPYWKNHYMDYMDLCWQSDVSAF